MQDSSINIWTVSVSSPRWRNHLFWTFPPNTLILVQIQLPSVSGKWEEHPVDDARPVADRENVPVAWLRWAFYSGMSKPSHSVSSAKTCTCKLYVYQLYCSHWWSCAPSPSHLFWQQYPLLQNPVLACTLFPLSHFQITQSKWPCVTKITNDRMYD